MSDDHFEMLTMAFASAFYDLPELPPVEVLSLLKYPSYAIVNNTDVAERGDALQQKYGFDRVPPKAEYQWAAGLWSIIREAIVLEQRKKAGG